MKWNEYKLYKVVEGEVDDYGDMIHNKTLINTIPCRLASWARKDIELYGREKALERIRVITPYKNIDTSEELLLEDSRGSSYTVEEVKELGRFKALIIKEL